ncbi:MAG: hypothetical protein R2932_22785 [Caldilineaceae bacterium]
MVLATNPDGQAVRWYDPSLELFYWIVDPAGNLLSLEQISPTNPETAHWLPALEQWDWAQPQRTCVEVLVADVHGQSQSWWDWRG